jgi:tetratricopeptide (TPR) repeat protein
VNLGVHRANHGRSDLALDYFERALRADPSYALAHAHCGTVLFQRGRARQALFHLKKTLELDPLQPGHEQLERQVRHLEQSLPPNTPPSLFD